MSKCSKKIFKEKIDALIALWKAEQDRRTGSGYSKRKERRIYYCKTCKGWHLTSKKSQQNIK